MRRNQLVLHDAALPTQVTLQPGVVNGVDVVLPLLVMLYNDDEEARREMSSYCKANSQNGAVWADKARLVAKVRVLNAKKGNSTLISENDDAKVSYWCSCGARYLDGIARSKRLKAARSAALLAAQAPLAPDDDEEETGS